MRLLIALATLTLAACAPTAAETAANTQRQAAEADKLAKALAGLVPDGKPANCLPTVGTQQSQLQTQGYGPVILYRYGRSLVYRSDTAGGCERIARGDILVTRQVGSQLCAGDIATTVDPTTRFQTGSCSLGPFTTYRRP